jgi:hypothetical protein
VRLPELLRGPAPVWPAWLDVALEAWAGLPARARTAGAGLVAGVLVLAAGGGLLEGPWGPAVAVLTTTETVAPGEPLAGRVAVTRRPMDVLPTDWISPAGLATDAVATGHLPAGAVVSAAQVTPGGPAAALTLGRALVPLPRDALPDLPPGTRLRLAAAGADGSAVTLAQTAVVSHADAVRMWVEVGEQEVAGVAAAAGRGALVAGVLAGSGAGPPPG